MASFGQYKYIYETFARGENGNRAPCKEGTIECALLKTHKREKKERL
jgi:hypothetical protein